MDYDELMENFDKEFNDKTFDKGGDIERLNFWIRHLYMYSLTLELRIEEIEKKLLKKTEKIGK